jgi:TetR/AcrR family transcriptional regulator, fatty acid metabolism regulator protein
MPDRGRNKARKDKIMEAALRIFADKGFQNATIAEISKEAGVSEATIYEYFGTKEDLLIAIPQKVSNDTYEAMQRVLPYVKGVEARLRALLHGYVDLYQNNPDYSALVLLQLMSNKRFRQTAAHDAIRRSARGVLLCVREGIADGTFRKDTNAFLVRSMLLGTIEHLFIRWHMEGRPERTPSNVELLDGIIDTVLNGIRAERREAGLTLRLDMGKAAQLGELLLGAQRAEQEKRGEPGPASPAKKTGTARHAKKGAAP